MHHGRLQGEAKAGVTNVKALSDPVDSAKQKTRPVNLHRRLAVGFGEAHSSRLIFVAPGLLPFAQGLTRRTANRTYAA